MPAGKKSLVFPQGNLLEYCILSQEPLMSGK